MVKKRSFSIAGNRMVNSFSYLDSVLGNLRFSLPDVLSEPAVWRMTRKYAVDKAFQLGYPRITA